MFCGSVRCLLWPSRKMRGSGRSIIGFAFTQSRFSLSSSLVLPCSFLCVSGVTVGGQCGVIPNHLHILRDKHFPWQPHGAPSLPLAGASNLWPRMVTQPNAKSYIYLKHREICFVITCHNVFNMWPKTILLLPV